MCCFYLEVIILPAETHVRQNVNRDLSTSTENVRNVLDHVQKVRHINIIILLNLIYSVIIFFLIAWVFCNILQTYVWSRYTPKCLEFDCYKQCKDYYSRAPGYRVWAVIQFNTWIFESPIVFRTQIASSMFQASTWIYWNSNVISKAFTYNIQPYFFHNFYDFKTFGSGFLYICLIVVTFFYLCVDEWWSVVNF